jgi:hypothetical protein
MKTLSRYKTGGLLTGLLIAISPAFGAEVLLYEENFEDPSREIIATPENNPDPSTVPAGSYVIVGNRDDGGDNVVARRMIGSDGLQVRAGGTLEGDWVYAFQDIDFSGVGPRGDEFEGEGLNNRAARLKFPNIDISGYGNIRVELTIAAGFGAGNEPNDDFYVRTRVDGGEWIEIGGFKAPSSNNVPAYYQGPRDTVTTADMEDRLILGYFGDWDWPVFGNGSSLEVQLTAEGNAGNEDFHVGAIRIYGDADVKFVDASFANTQVTEPESGGIANPLTLTIGEAAPEGGVTFELTPSDGRSASSLGLPSTTVSIPAGETLLEVPVEIVQDGQFTGTKIVDLFIDAPGYNSGFARVLVENVTPLPNVKITEVLNVVPGLQPEDVFGDANGDGVYHNTNDQFIEIVNFDSQPVDLTDWRIGDDLADRHLIPEGTILAPNQVLVVFGGGTPSGTFGGATVQLPSGGGNGLGFNIDSRAEIAYLNAPFGAAVDLVNIPLQRSDMIPITEALPEGHAGRGVSASIHALSKEGPWDYGREWAADHIHSMIAGAEQRLFSPGTWFDGTPYFEAENIITLTLDTDVLLESDGTTATATLSLANAAPAGGYEVTLDTDGVMMQDDGTFVPDEIILDSLVVTIPEGQTSATFDVTAYNDGVLDGDRTVLIFARGGTYALNGFASLTVVDAETSDLNVVINEMFTNVNETGTDNNLDGLTDDELGDQYVELVNASGRPVNMSNWKLTWDTGGTFAAERLIHVFPDGTWVPDGGSIIVFGKISPQAANDPIFAGAIVQTARNANGGPKKNGLDMRIDETFDIKLFNEYDFLVDIIEETADSTINQGMAVTRSPDITGEAALHLEVSPVFALSSPGTQIDGTPFAGNGTIWAPMVFNRINQMYSDGNMYDPSFGWLAVENLTSEDYWIYSFNLGSFWYVYPGSQWWAMYVYDLDVQSWLFTSYIYYPWIYNYTTDQWSNVE